MKTLSEKIEFYSSALRGVDVLSATNSSRAWRVFHETYTVCTVLGKCRAWWTYRKQEYEAGLGQLMLMEPGEIHQSKAALGQGNFKVLYLPPPLVDSMLGEAGVSGGVHWNRVNVRNPAIFISFLGLHRAIVSGAELLEQQSRFAHCLESLVQYSAENRLPESMPTHRRHLLRARDYICDHWRENLSLDVLARIAGLSRFHFLRSFRAEFGLPPHAFQTQIRVSRACRILRFGDSELKGDFGFCDQSHFIRQFKRTWGVTPGQYVAMIHRPRVFV